MVAELDPLSDPRWEDLLQRHPFASVFHTSGWLRALKETYGYEPFALTTSGEGPLENGLVLCQVKTWLSRRLVSLPFSDHCDLLVDRPEHLSRMLDFLKKEMAAGGWHSLELRPRTVALTAGTVTAGVPAPGSREELKAASGNGLEGPSYYLHTLDLSGPLEGIFAKFHHSSAQRAIRRAEREGLRYEAGASEELLSGFYHLLRLARRRHGLPPQPLAWFRNLLACLGDKATIHLASKDGLPVAGILTLTFKKTMVYKYGGSDARHHSLGGMPFLFWRAIQTAREKRLEQLDLGRSDLDQPGLAAFKEHLGAARSELTYYCLGAGRRRRAGSGVLVRAARPIVARLPDVALDLTGRLLYRHLG